MNYVSVTEAAKIWNLNPVKIRKMCRNGLIKGVKKVSNSWLIPEELVNTPESSPVNAERPDIKINNFREYLETFFEILSLSSDISGEHNYKSFIRGSIDEFLNNGTKDNAFGVYQTFLDSYQIIDEKTSNPFVDLLDTLRKYEENASVLIDKQRDHYAHSVNVFLLGLAIYAQNKKYQEVFNEVILGDNKPSCVFTTKNEEFFYRWGIAALFHDVGYPAEISVKQAGKFFNLITSVEENNKLVVQIGVDDFQRLDSIALLGDNKFTAPYATKYHITDEINLLKPTDLLAHQLHLSFGIDLPEIKKAVDEYVDELAKVGVIDHGFYSALIVLKWYGHLIQVANRNPEEFYFQILDAASAILLHNYYKNYFCENKRFNHGPMHVKEHPLAWLLILCDELQEWSREAYGILDKKRVMAADASLFISEGRMAVTYIAATGSMKEKFSEEKEADLQTLLHLEDIFYRDFSIGCETMDVLGELAASVKEETEYLPRPLMANLEKLAIGIHDHYNLEQLIRYPDKELDYPRFADLPETLKYSNLRQARDIVKKLELIHCEMRPIGSSGTVVTEFSSEEIEELAIYEHDLWMRERISSGWRYGPIKDVEKKLSPYLIPYSELTEEIKQLDRDTINNIPTLLKMIGMAVYRIAD